MNAGELPERNESNVHRERLLSAVLWTTATGFGLVCPWVLMRETTRPLTGAVFACAFVATLAAALIRSLGFRIRLTVLLLCLYSAAVMTVATRGFAPNVFMLFGLMVVLVTLLSGSRAGLIAVAVDGLTLLSVSLLQNHGVLVRDADWLHDFDSALLPTAVRVDVIFFLIMFAFVAAVSYVVERSEELAGQNASALAALQREQAEKAQAVADLMARDAALHALNLTLEQRVYERTAQVVEANRSLSHEMEARLKMEMELRQAQKLESVGRLAAGIAHEINTPVQFTADSVEFAQESMTGLASLIGNYQRLETDVAAGRAVPAQASALAAQRDDLELDYLLEHTPRALARALEGLERVANIVRSMKLFAYPDREEMSPIDLNAAIASTLIIARGEYRQVAEVRTRYGALPPVACHPGEVNQVILNLLVNAAHAIEDVVRDTGAKGLITIDTAHEGSSVTIAIGDTGGGIPEEIHDRIFDPFFTTKEVGRGTGQGLAIARSVIVDKHGGELTFTSARGQGTTFTIRLPVEGKRPAVEKPALG